VNDGSLLQVSASEVITAETGRNIAYATVFGSVGASVMEVTKDPNSNPGLLDDSDPELELYTIPSSSSKHSLSQP